VLVFGLFITASVSLYAGTVRLHMFSQPRMFVQTLDLYRRASLGFPVVIPRGRAGTFASLANGSAQWGLIDVGLVKCNLAAIA